MAVTTAIRPFLSLEEISANGDSGPGSSIDMTNETLRVRTTAKRRREKKSQHGELWGFIVSPRQSIICRFLYI